VALVDDLNNEPSQRRKRPWAAVPKRGALASSVIASTVLGLDPVDRDALFGDFETLVPGPCSPCRSPCQASPYAKALQARQRLLRRLGGGAQREAQSAAAAVSPLAAGGLDLAFAGGLDESRLPPWRDDVAEQLC